MSYYYNTAGQRFSLPERPLEPLDCWGEGPSKEKNDGENHESANTK